MAHIWKGPARRSGDGALSFELLAGGLEEEATELARYLQAVSRRTAMAFVGAANDPE